MRRTEPSGEVDILAAIERNRAQRERLIEKAATIGLTPKEAQRASRMDEQWRADLDAWQIQQEAQQYEGN